MKNIALAMVLLIFFVGETLFADDIVFPQGAERELTAKDFFQNTQDDIKYNEIWRYNFVFNNGTKVFLSYSIMDVPLLGTNCGINISFYNYGGKNYQVGREYSEDCFVQSKGSDTGIQIRTRSENNVFFMAGLPGDGHRVVFKTSKKQGFLLDLRFSNPLLGKVVGDGVFKIGRQKIGLYVHIPEGRVKGVVGIGKDIIKVEGSGYMEHLRHTKPPLDLAAYSLLLYGKDAPYAGNIFVGSKKDGSFPFGYIIDKQTRKILFPNEVKSGNNNFLNNIKFLNDIHITWRNSPRMVTIQNLLEHQCFSFLSTMDGWASKQAIRLFMGGEMMSLRGVSHVNLQPTHFCLFFIK